MFSYNRKNIKKFINSRFYLPSHSSLLIKDYFDFRTPYRKLGESTKHLDAAISWLCAAQNFNGDGGVAARYRMDSGWTHSYPETTGYIIETFFDYAHFSEKDEYFERASRMADWLLTTQIDNGAFPGNNVSVTPVPRVFNTGQIMIGLIRAYRETENEKYLDAAVRAGTFLVERQEDDGYWIKFSYHDRPHAYHSRVAWPVLQLWEVTGEEMFRQAGAGHLNWVVSLQEENGWFNQTGFTDDKHPFLHTIAYTIRGLLEGGIIFKANDVTPNKYITAAEKAAFALLKRYEIRKFMSTKFDKKWKGVKRESCLTGNSQMGIIWLRLFQISNDIRYLNGALKINEFVKSTQQLNSKNPKIYGAIKGSHPVWGEYISYSYPNWATKFFADSLLLEEKIMSEIELKEEMNEFSINV